MGEDEIAQMNNVQRTEMTRLEGTQAQLTGGDARTGSGGEGGSLLLSLPITLYAGQNKY